METTTAVQKQQQTEIVMTPEQLLEHWQGHRRLTRRIIEQFPERELFEFSIGGMRPFADLAVEMIQMAGPGIKGVVSRKWTGFDYESPLPKTKEDLLKMWDETTETINNYWPNIPEGRFQEKDIFFGQYEGSVYWGIFYFIDNEIHHRGQGYVYLRALNIPPTPFWERG